MRRPQRQERPAGQQHATAVKMPTPPQCQQATNLNECTK
jgi:hypothetical protein